MTNNFICTTLEISGKLVFIYLHNSYFLEFEPITDVEILINCWLTIRLSKIAIIIFLMVTQKININVKEM